MPAGVKLGMATVVEEALLRVPVLSVAHTVEAPSPALNSSTPYSATCPVMELDQLKLTVADPVVVTLPYQISSSAPTDPAKLRALVQVATPPPETDDTVKPAALVWAKTTSTSPAVLGDTARVLVPDPSTEAKVPTAVMVPVVGTL